MITKAPLGAFFDRSDRDVNHVHSVGVKQAQGKVKGCAISGVGIGKRGAKAVIG